MQAIAGLPSSGLATTETVPQPRLVKAAHEFEAQMMKELLKPMMEKGALGGEGEDSDAGSGGALGEFASEALGRALSEQGGFGLSKQIVRDLSHSGNKSANGKVT
jgi:flagellar protein FlgJ